MIYLLLYAVIDYLDVIEKLITLNLLESFRVALCLFSRFWHYDRHE